MRVNHTGEVCAQALYLGQAIMAQDPILSRHLYKASEEERQHLDWCANRVHALQAQTSRLSPLFAVGSFGLGLLAGFLSDRISLGFLAETEKQVSAHLDNHLKIVGDQDLETKQILLQMKADEQKHEQEAWQRGAIPLPKPICFLMRCFAKVMTTTTQYI